MTLSLFPEQEETSSPAPAPSFDLRFQPWIPVVGNDGRKREVGLEDALLLAHEWRAISDPLPTVEFGLYRVLVALVLDIFEPQNTLDWSDLWDEGRFDAGRVRAYFDEHEGAFDLFSAARPWLQNAGMEQEEDKPISLLIHPLPTGGETNHFHHFAEDAFSVSPSVAARLLTTLAPFAMSSGRGWSPSINGAPPWYVLPVGYMGFETLMLNCQVVDDLLFCSGDVPVIWKQQEAFEAGEKASSSLLQSLTWRPRAIQLVPSQQSGECSLTGQESGILVRHIKMGYGWKTRFDWRDPNTAYYYKGPERKILRSQKGKELWRDTGPLALLQNTVNTTRKRRFERPAIISQLVLLVGNDYIAKGKPLDLLIYGMRHDMQAKVFEWHKERLRLPLRLAWDQVEANDAQDAIELAEEVAFEIKRAVKATYIHEGRDNRGKLVDAAFQTLCDATSKAFWRDLRAAYDALLAALARADSDQTRAGVRADWRNTLRAQGWKTLREAIDDLDGDAELLRRQTNAYSGFSRALSKILKT